LPIHRLTAGEVANSCELAIESTLVYLSAVNKFVRSCIERGADSGMSKNFAQYIELLGKEVAVTDLTNLPAEATPAEVSVTLLRCSGLGTHTGYMP
jgi:hypothetical protein